MAQSNRSTINVHSIAIEFQGKGAGTDFVRGLPTLASHDGDLTVRNLRELAG